MNLFNTLIAVLAAISLFLFSLKGFSKELQHHGAGALKDWLSRVTRWRVLGFVLGTALTAIVQSSSVVTSIVVALVDSHVISFFASLSVLVGANLGSTFTAWLVAFKLNNLGSWLIVGGTALSMLQHTRLGLAGKSVFYLGLILFSLQQINIVLAPLSEEAEIVYWLKQANYVPLGLLAGAVVTAIIQSSSVTSGLTIILAMQGLLDLNGALALVIGSNIGTTSTGLLASLSLSKAAKSTALANLIFNVLGLCLFLPFFNYFRNFIASLDSLDIGFKVATAHLLFNLVTSVVALPLLRPLSRVVLWLSPLPKGETADRYVPFYEEDLPQEPL